VAFSRSKQQITCCHSQQVAIVDQTADVFLIIPVSGGESNQSLLQFSNVYFAVNGLLLCELVRPGCAKIGQNMYCPREEKAI